MDIIPQPKLLFQGVDIVKIDFKSQHNLSKPKKRIHLHIIPKVIYPDDPLFFKIIMEVRVEAEDCFYLDIIAVGTFKFGDEVTEKLKKDFVHSNAPAIMFPYVRSFIATLTANLGNVTSTLNIPIHFFQGELEIVETIN